MKISSIEGEKIGTFAKYEFVVKYISVSNADI